jgi:hypothetical protein
MRVLLRELAHVRTGDKGDTSNVAVIAYQARHFPYLAEQLTAEAFKDFYQGLIRGDVERYCVERLGVMNFVAHGALAGGVSRSLRLDNFGKALGAAILGFQVDLPGSEDDLLERP